MDRLEILSPQGDVDQRTINLRTGRLARTSDPATWASFAAGLGVLSQGKIDGLGICRSDDFVFIDLDGVLDEAGEWRAFSWVKPWARLWGKALFAKSVSGKGVHIISRGELPPGKRQIDFPPPPEHTGFGIYDGNRFLALSGHPLERGPK